MVKNQRLRSSILWGKWAVQERNMTVGLWCLESEEGFG